MWQTITAIAVPLLGILGAVLGGGRSRFSKRMSQHADLLPRLDGAEKAKAAPHALLAKEVAWLDERESRRYRRKVNKRNLTRAAASAMSTAGFTSLTLAWVFLLDQSNSPWIDIALPAYAVILAGGIVMTGFYAIRIFDPTPAIWLDQMLRDSEEKRTELQRRSSS
jgi:Na+/glutamate symporter